MSCQPRGQISRPIVRLVLENQDVAISGSQGSGSGDQEPVEYADIKPLDVV